MKADALSLYALVKDTSAKEVIQDIVNVAIPGMLQLFSSASFVAPVGVILQGFYSTYIKHYANDAILNQLAASVNKNVGILGKYCQLVKKKNKSNTPEFIDLQNEMKQFAIEIGYTSYYLSNTLNTKGKTLLQSTAHQIKRLILVDKENRDINMLEKKMDSALAQVTSACLLWIGDWDDAETHEEMRRVDEEVTPQRLERRLSENKLEGGVTAVRTTESMFNVRAACDDFVGRAAVLARIATFFDQAGHPSVPLAVVCGPGGTGKTQTILKYIEVGKAKYNERVFWIQAETAQTLSMSFLELASKLGIEVEKRDEDDVLKDIHRKLSTMPQALFVFDNVEDRALIQKYVPKYTNGEHQHHVILTTRSQSYQWPDSTHVEVLGQFDDADVKTFCLRWTSTFPLPDEIKELAATFSSMPLGLSQAAACIREYDLEISQYLSMYHRSVEVFGSDKGSYVTISIAMDSLVHRYPKAVELLQVCAFLYADNIPVNIFDALFPGDADGLKKALLLLQSRKLLTWQQGEVFIHRLVQEVIQAKLTAVDKVGVMTRAAELLDAKASSSGDAKAVLTKNKPLLSHMLSILAHRAALQLMDSALSHKLDVSSARLLIEVGNLYYNQGKYDLALEKYEESLRIYEWVLGHDHPDVARSLHGIASVYYHQGKYDLALEKYEESLRIDELMLGHDHPSVASSLNNIALVYKDQGKYDLALEKYEESLHIKELMLGHDHPSVATSLNNIASLYDNQGKYDLALEKYEESLRIYELMLGHDHPSVARSLNNIATVYDNQGKYDLALEKYKESLRIRVLMLGHDHPDVARSLNSIAYVYYYQGKYDLALEKFEEALRIRVLVLGHDHPSVASSLINIGLVIGKMQ